MMDKNQRNKQYMLNAVLLAMEAHKASWEAEPRLVELVDELQNRFDGMEDLLKTKMDLGIAYTGVKKDAWERFARRLTVLAGYLHDIAVNSGVPERALHLKVTEAQIARGSMQSAATVANSVLNIAREFETELAAITDGAQLHTEVADGYKNFLKEGLLPSQRRKRRAEVNAEIKVQQTEISQLLKSSLDMLMRRYLDDDREFYLAYTRARVIPKLNGGRLPGVSESEDDSDGFNAEAGDASESGDYFGSDSDPTGNESSEDTEE